MIPFLVICFHFSYSTFEIVLFWLLLLIGLLVGYISST